METHWIDQLVLLTLLTKHWTSSDCKCPQKNGTDAVEPIVTGGQYGLLFPYVIFLSFQFFSWMPVGLGRECKLNDSPQRAIWLLSRDARLPADGHPMYLLTLCSRVLARFGKSREKYKCHMQIFNLWHQMQLTSETRSMNN